MMRAITIRQPWAFAILYAGKTHENRRWKTFCRGPVLIHAAKGMTHDEYQSGIEFIALAAYEAGTANLAEYEKLKNLVIPDYDEMIRGAIVGAVDIVDCVTESDSPWFQGKYGFVLKNPRLIKEPVPCKGALNFWEVPPEVEQEIRRQYATAKEAA